MQTNLYSVNSLIKTLPDEIKNHYSAEKLISANHHTIILSLTSKSTNSREKTVLKILDKKYYDKSLYQQIITLTDTSLLLPIQELSDNSHQYFLYPHLTTLSELLSSESINYLLIHRLISAVGDAVAKLHCHGILHLDITPNNIFADQKKNFYLGDFSSARSAKFIHLPAILSGHICRTGTTRAFAPPGETKHSSFSYWNDCYNLSLLFYLLLNNGCPPDEHSPAGSSPFGNANSILLKWMVKTPHVHSNMVKEFLTELESALLSCDADDTCQSYSLQITDSNKNYLFESTAECTQEQKNPNRKFLSSIPVTQYGLLIMCSLIFLFSLYHYLSWQGDNADIETDRKIILSENKKLAKTSSPEKTNYFSASPTPSWQPSGSPEILASPAPDLTDIQSKPDILDISNTIIQDTFYSKEESDWKNLRIIFANSCHITSCTEFSSLSSLEELYLNKNEIVTVNGLQYLSKLKVLVLSENKLENISYLTRISTLTTLDLSHNYNLKGLNSLSSLKNLSCLILTNTNIPKKEILSLQKKLPHCNIFY